MSQQEVPIDIAKGQKSPTCLTAPKVLYSAASPTQHKCLQGNLLGSKSSKELPDGIPSFLFSFTDMVLAQSVSEGPAGRREILFQENDESPVKGPSRAMKEEEKETRPFMQLMHFETAPELPELKEHVSEPLPLMEEVKPEVTEPVPVTVREVNESSKSPNHAALTSLLNLILKEQDDIEEQVKSRGKTPEKTRQLSINLVNKFTGLQKNSQNSSQTSLHERSERTTEKSSRIHTEPTSKAHSRVGSWAKLNPATQQEIIWETTELESGTIYRKRTSRLSADYSHLVKQYEDLPQKNTTEQVTPTLSPKHLMTEGSTPVKGLPKTAKKLPFSSFGSKTKQLLKAKLFPNKPHNLKVKATLGRWPVV